MARLKFHYLVYCVYIMLHLCPSWKSNNFSVVLSKVASTLFSLLELELKDIRRWVKAPWCEIAKTVAKLKRFPAPTKTQELTMRLLTFLKRFLKQHQGISLHRVAKVSKTNSCENWFRLALVDFIFLFISFFPACLLQQTFISHYPGCKLFR